MCHLLVTPKTLQSTHFNENSTLNLNLVSFQFQLKALGLTAQKCQRWICGSSGFSWLSVGKAVLTLVSVTLGHSDDIDHLVLGEHLADGHLLLKVLTGKVDLNVFD